MPMDDTTTIEIKRKTWKQLNYRKDLGESFDDVIQGLMGAEIREFEDGEEPEMVGYTTADPEAQCSYVDPDHGPCDNDADYVVTMEYQGTETDVRLCRDHANLNDDGM